MPYPSHSIQGKKFTELTEEDLDSIKSAWGKDMSEQYRKNRDLMIIKLRTKKIHDILNRH